MGRARRAAEGVAVGAVRGVVRRGERRGDPVGRSAAVRRVAARAIARGDEAGVSGGQRPRVQRAQAAELVGGLAREAGNQRHDQAERENRQPAANAPQGAPRHARRHRLRTAAVGLGPVGARAAGGRRPAAFVAAVRVPERGARGGAAASAVDVGPVRARLAPGRAASAAIGEVRPLVRAAIETEAVRIENPGHSAYTCTRIVCQIASANTATASGRWIKSHIFMIDCAA